LEIIDLSHIIYNGMPKSPILPDVMIKPFIKHEETKELYQGCSIEVLLLTLSDHTGTYVDAPYHFDPDGKTIDELELSRFICGGNVLDVRRKAKAGKYITADDLDKTGEVRENQATLICTGWDKYWETRQYYAHPFLSKDAAEWLVKRKSTLIGVDCLMIDNPKDLTRPVHVTLLKQNRIPIVENLCNLHLLIGKNFELVALPLKIKRGTGSPIRAVAVVR